MISLNKELRDGFNLYNVLAYRSESEEPPDIEKGYALAQSIQKILPEEEFLSLVSSFGGFEVFVEMLSRSRLKTEKIAEDRDLEARIRALNHLPPSSRLVNIEYERFRSGRRRFNPIQTLDEISVPVVKEVLVDVLRSGVPSQGLSKRLKEIGFFRLLSTSGGITNIIHNIDPGLLIQIPRSKKWSLGEKSIELALLGIQNVLYTLPGYKNAEEAGNRAEQVRIINDFVLNEPRLADYFYNRGLRNMNVRLIDPTGETKLKRMSSTLAILKFYDRRKGLNWFDRTQRTYVQAWRIRSANMWQKGEESVKLALEAIQDVLFELPGYRVAEETENRAEQVRIINELLKREKQLQQYFLNHGLDSMMSQMVDPEGENGLKRDRSNRAVLEFYSRKKKLNWFNRTQDTYVHEWRFREHGMWDGSAGIERAINAFQDILFELPGYRLAEKTGNRTEQIRIINDLIKNYPQLAKYFVSQGLGGLMGILVDPTGENGLRIRSSAGALLEFYSDKMELNWFDKSKRQYIQIFGHGKLRVIC